jgi:hypothetical protein
MTETIKPFPIIKDIEITRGGDWHETIELLEDDKVTPKDTTGYTMSMFILSRHQNGDLYDTLTVANGKIVHTPVSGQFNLNLTAAQIDAYEFTSAVRRVVFDDGAGNTTPLMIGNVRVV